MIFAVEVAMMATMSIALLLSGGVDSSTALMELVRDGRRVTAFYLKVWLEDERAQLGNCPWAEDLEWARAVCCRAGVPLEVLPMQREYHEWIVDYVIEALRRGHTPSPDLLCNRHIKFGLFLDRVGQEFARVASGHYARLDYRNGMARIRCAPDPIKDQTYFLARLRQEQVRRLLFPIGGYTKEQVRGCAAAWGLPNSARRDSQGICFLGDIRYNHFVRHYLGDRSGAIVEQASGRILGRHRGHWFYTIGQRRGLGLGGGPWYVVEKVVAENCIYVAHSAAGRRLLRVGALNWIADPPEQGCLRVKLRHGPQLIGCYLAPPDDEHPDEWKIELESADGGIAPGQFAVFYDGDICLGSGEIVTAE